MAMARMMITLSCLAALTFVSNASLFSKGVIYTILCTIGRIDWSDITFTKTAANALSEVATEPDAVDSPAASVDSNAPTLENVSIDNGDAQDIIGPTIGCLPVLDTASQDTKHRSRASSISSTSSLFDKPTPRDNDRPSTPDTDIGDIPEFSTLACKYQDGPVVVNTECLAEPSTTATFPNIQLPPAPTSPSSNTPATKYSMKPTELVHAVEDFSFELPILTPTTSNKRSLDDTFQHESKMANEGSTRDDASLVSATKKIEQQPQSTVPTGKKRKLNSRQRRQRALRQASGLVSPGPSPLSKGE